MFRPPLGPIVVANVHVVIAEIGQCRRGFFGELADTLDGVNVAGNPGQNGRRITGSGADLEDSFAPLKREGFHHERNDVWLRDCLTFVDRQRAILIGKFAKLLRQERLTRNGAHGVQNQFGANAACENRLFDHFVAQARKISFKMKSHGADPEIISHDDIKYTRDI